jgi:hypothetical protein
MIKSITIKNPSGELLIKVKAMTNGRYMATIKNDVAVKIEIRNEKNQKILV